MFLGWQINNKRHATVVNHAILVTHTTEERDPKGRGWPESSPMAMFLHLLGHTTHSIFQFWVFLGGDISPDGPMEWVGWWWWVAPISVRHLHVLPSLCSKWSMQSYKTECSVSWSWHWAAFSTLQPIFNRSKSGKQTFIVWSCWDLGLSVTSNSPILTTFGQDLTTQPGGWAHQWWKLP